MRFRRASTAAMVAAGLVLTTPVVTACTGTGGELQDESPDEGEEMEEELGEDEDSPREDIDPGIETETPG